MYVCYYSYMEVISVVSAKIGIPKVTIQQAARRGALGNAAKLSGNIWLIDVDHVDFKLWKMAHENQPRVVGHKKAREASSSLE